VHHVYNVYPVLRFHANAYCGLVIPEGLAGGVAEGLTHGVQGFEVHLQQTVQTVQQIIGGSVGNTGLVRKEISRRRQGLMQRLLSGTGIATAAAGRRSGAA